MPASHLIRVKEDVYKKLLVIQGHLQAGRGQRVSLNETIKELVSVWESRELSKKKQ